MLFVPSQFLLVCGRCPLWPVGHTSLRGPMLVYRCYPVSPSVVYHLPRNSAPGLLRFHASAPTCARSLHCNASLPSPTREASGPSALSSKRLGPRRTLRVGESTRA